MSLSDSTPISGELGWSGLLATLTELVGRECSARIYNSSTSPPLASTTGHFPHTLEPFDSTEGSLFIPLGAGLITLDPRALASARRLVLPGPRGSQALIVEITLTGGGLIELETALQAG